VNTAALQLLMSDSIYNQRGMANGQSELVESSHHEAGGYEASLHQQTRYYLSGSYVPAGR